MLGLASSYFGGCFSICRKIFKTCRKAGRFQRVKRSVNLDQDNSSSPPPRHRVPLVTCGTTSVDPSGKFITSPKHPPAKSQGQRRPPSRVQLIPRRLPKPAQLSGNPGIHHQRPRGVNRKGVVAHSRPPSSLAGHRGVGFHKDSDGSGRHWRRSRPRSPPSRHTFAIVRKAATQAG